MSNYNNEALIELQNRVQSLQAERDRLREALDEVVRASNDQDVGWEESCVKAFVVARKALEGVGG